MKARKPPKGGKSRADEKSALSVCKHGILCRVSENGQQNTMLVRGKFPLKPLNKKTADAVKSERRLL